MGKKQIQWGAARELGSWAIPLLNVGSYVVESKEGTEARKRSHRDDPLPAGGRAGLSLPLAKGAPGDANR